MFSNRNIQQRSPLGTPVGFAFAIVAILWSAPASIAQEADVVERDAAEAARLQSRLMGAARQLTFAGKRAGEGYFSADGNQLVFQSEREADNPFYQIYLMDLETGDTNRISPGFGKTTCAWIHPTGEKVLFASTQYDPQARQKQADEIAFRESGQERRYSWDYDETYELVEFDVTTGEYRRLTNAVGYDAEGSYSPDGNWICFASNRRAYTGELTDEEQELFEQDPASAMDLYIMKADGSGLKRLTDVVGYDGGPFFSPDGQRICWRRFSKNGATAEIMTMSVDGTDEKTLTGLKAMSWAPYFHPSGDYLIFTTNRHGFANFELYLIDAQGQQEPVRVTYRKGFDGLPVFTPDGDKLVWTSRGESSQSQLYEATWDDAAARELLGIGQASENEDRALAQESARQTATEFLASDVGRHVDFLCRPELGGRLTGTPGERRATAYVAAYLESLGLKPAGENGTFFHEFEFISDVRLGEGNRLVSGENTYTLDDDWRPVFFSKEGEIDAADVVCAGYGIVAPATEGHDEYDSYVHLDVQDKWVLVFRQMPQDISPERRQHMARFSGARYKAMVARDRGARGIIFVSGPNSPLRRRLMPLTMDGTMGGSSIAVISVSDRLAANWMQAAGKDLKAIQSGYDSGEPAMGFSLEGVSVAAAIDIEPVKGTGRNVLALLPSGEKPSLEMVLVGAHIDHLGTGAGSGSLAKPEEQGGVHRGADDNASGVAAVLEMAQYLSQQVESGKLKPKRDILFAAWSGEELGLLGSDAFAEEFTELYPKRFSAWMQAMHSGHLGAIHESEHGAAHEVAGPKVSGSKVAGHSVPAVAGHAVPDRESTSQQIAVSAEHGQTKANAQRPTLVSQDASDGVAASSETVGDDSAHGTATQKVGPVKPAASMGQIQMPLYPMISSCINLDMVGRLRDNLVLQGIGSSPYWAGAIERRNAVVRLSLTLQNDCHLPTDASSFFTQGVPILSAFTGSHAEYHTPRDVPELLNYEGAAQVARLMSLIVRDLVQAEAAPEYVDQPAEPEMRANLTAYLGTIPDYAQEDVEGVLLNGVTKGAPAELGGMQGGDVIVELAGKKIENIYDYTYAIEALKIGQPTSAKVRRGEKVIELEITPASRQ